MASVIPTIDLGQPTVGLCRYYRKRGSASYRPFRLMMALTPKRLFLYLCISISLLRPYTLFSRSPLVNKTLYRPFPDIACCHGSHHFHTIGSIVAGKKPAPAGVLASVRCRPIAVVPSVRPQFPVVSSLIFLALERTGMEEGITAAAIADFI